MRHLVALLGRDDKPTDGVADYCSFLGEALARRGVEFKLARVCWAEDGWWRALRRLRGQSGEWRGKWVLLQYTALGWSRRGFPFGVVVALSIVRRHGARCSVVFHEAFCAEGPRLVDHIRNSYQRWVVRWLYHTAEKVIVTTPVETIRWLPSGDKKTKFVPIGANIPEFVRTEGPSTVGNGTQKTVAVFCLSDPPNQKRELSDISHALRAVAMEGSKPRVVFLGRGTAEAQREIERAFERVPVDVTNLGLRSAAEVARMLAKADAMLCVRGELFPGRGSAIAGIACGLPIVAYGDTVRSFPLSEAGVRLVPYGDREALGMALAQVLNDADLRKRLRARSCDAMANYFSWGVIAERIDQALEETRAKK